MLLRNNACFNNGAVAGLRTYLTYIGNRAVFIGQASYASMGDASLFRHPRPFEGPPSRLGLR